MSARLKFLPPQDRPETERQKNLRSALAKSHAARQSHSRRRGQYYEFSAYDHRRSLSVKPQCIKTTTEAPLRCADRLASTSDRQSWSGTAARASIAATSAALNGTFWIHQPDMSLFRFLPVLEHAEKEDIIHYIATGPARLIGACNDNLLAQVTALIVAEVQSSPSNILWILLSELNQRSHTNPSHKLNVYGRRGKIYQRLNTMLADPVLQCSDELLSMVISAPCVEHHMDKKGDRSRIRVHYRGLLRLIDKRGGLSSLFGFVSTLSHPIVLLPHLLHAELEVADREEAQHCCDVFLDMLNELQAHAQTHGRFPIAERFPSLKYFVPREGQSQGLAEQIIRFLSLYLTMVMIWDFGSNMDVIEKFLTQLSNMMDARINFSVQEGGFELDALVWMVVWAWVEVDASTMWPGSGSQKELWITQTGIDGLKVFGRLSLYWRQWLIQLLADWFCAGCGNGEHEYGPEAGQERSVPHLLTPKRCAEIKTLCCSEYYERHVVDGQN